MGNVRKLMARLNPSSVKFDIGRGGLPELTPQDIAAAIGMAAGDLGADGEFALSVFCASWWPDSAGTSRKRAESLLLLAVMTEGNRREQAALAASLKAALMFAELPQTRRAVKPPAVMAAEAAVGRAEAARWPAITNSAHTYIRLVPAVISEVIQPPHCRACDGRGVVTSPTGPRRCSECKGIGAVAKSGRARAEDIGVSQTSMCKGWSAIYDWAYACAVDAESRAAVAISRRVFDREPRAA